MKTRLFFGKSIINFFIEVINMSIFPTKKRRVDIKKDAEKLIDYHFKRIQELNMFDKSKAELLKTKNGRKYLKR